MQYKESNLLTGFFFFERGFSEMIGQEMLVKLQLTGKNCQMHTDPELIKSISRKLTKKDSVIFVSLNGETKELVTAAKNCYDAEIGSILVHRQSFFYTQRLLRDKSHRFQIRRFVFP